MEPGSPALSPTETLPDLFSKIPSLLSIKSISDSSNLHQLIWKSDRKTITVLFTRERYLPLPQAHPFLNRHGLVPPSHTALSFGSRHCCALRQTWAYSKYFWTSTPCQPAPSRLSCLQGSNSNNTVTRLPVINRHPLAQFPRRITLCYSYRNGSYAKFGKCADNSRYLRSGRD